MRADGRDVEGYVQFRDVFEVDGDAVRDRSERLVEAVPEPVAVGDDGRPAQIMRESSRYNIGSIERNVNVPLAGADVLRPAYQPRFKFTMSTRAQRHAAGHAEVVRIHAGGRCAGRSISTRSSTPTVDSRRRRQDAKSHGRVWVDPDTGRVLMTELVVEAKTVESDDSASAISPSRSPGFSCRSKCARRYVG